MEGGVWWHAQWHKQYHDDNNDFMDGLSHIDEPECVTMANASHSSESDTDSDTDSELHPSSLNDDLATWATEHKITHVALNSLLSLLRKQDLNLPKDARTLLGTVRSNRTEVQNKAGGQYYHFGLLESISGVLYSNMDILRNMSNLKLQVSIDGLPLYKSSATQFWPILGTVQNLWGSYEAFNKYFNIIYSFSREKTKACEWVWNWSQILTTTRGRCSPV